MGRPARYPGDPEERPGLVERLDRIEASVSDARLELAEVKQKVNELETGCEE